MAKRPLRKTNRTVLIVVEGETEEAFTTHLKKCYYRRGMRLSVRIRNAHGHGPQGIIDKLKSVAKTEDFSQRIAVLDADIPLTAAEASWLRKEKVDGQDHQGNRQDDCREKACCGKEARHAQGRPDGRNR